MKTLNGFVALLVIVALAGSATAEDGVKLETTDAGMKAIEKLREWGVLVLEVAQNDNRLDVSYHLVSDTKIADEHLAPMKDLQRAYSVNLRGCEITGEGLSNLSKLPHLERLHLEKTKVTDDSLKQLTGLPKLTYLNLYGTGITDAGLKHLEGVKTLKSLYLFESKVTDAGVEQLKKALPELTVVR